MPRLAPTRTLLALGAAVLGTAAAFALRAQPGTAAGPAPGFAPNHLFVGGFDSGAGAGAVFEFDEEGTYVRTIPVAGADHLYAVTFGEDGNLYAATSNTHSIVRIDPQLGVSTQFDSSNGVGFAVGVARGATRVTYVGSRGAGLPLLALDSDGTTLAQYFDEFSAAPSYVVLGPQGHVYVSVFSGGQGHDAVVELDADLRPVRRIGDGAFSGYPSDAVFAPDGRVFVGDFNASVVRVFGSDGASQGTLATSGLSGPYGLERGPDGNLYVANYAANNVQVVDPGTGATVRTLTAPGMTYPAGLAFGPFRFATTLVVDTVASFEGAKAERWTVPAVFSVAPGSGRIGMVVSDPDAPFSASLVMSGCDSVAPDGKTWFAGGAGVSPKEAAHRIVTTAVAAKGSIGKGGAFVPKSLRGSLHFSLTNVSESMTIQKTKRLP